MKTYPITRYGRTWNITADDKIMEHHFAQGEPCEYHMLDWIEKNIQRGGVWVDAGANVGNHAIPFSFWSDLVISLEPMPQNFALLRQNIESNGIANVLPMAVGVGSAPNLMGAKLGGTGQNCQWILRPLEETSEWVLPVLRIDDIVPEWAKVRVLKMDVEGMEEAALVGASETIARCKPEIFLELWEDEALERVKVWLGHYGYTLIERWNVAPTYHFSASGLYPVTYTPPPKP